MKYQKTLLMSASCFLLAFLCSILWGYCQDGNLAGRIAPKILRFHVIANSNSRQDQGVKNQVRSLILERLGDCGADSKEEFCTYIEENREALEACADDFLEALGYDQRSHIQVTQAYFPTKAYGDLVLPCGTYDTVQVVLGEGRGRNWWCVLYPALCFIDSTHAVLPEESKEELKGILTEEDFSAVMEPEARIRIRLKIGEVLGIEQGIPFALKPDIPNEVTAAAIEEDRRIAHDSSVRGYSSLDE